MSLTTAHIKQLKAGMENFRLLFVDSEVVLHGGGVVQVPAYVTQRTARSDGLTEGIDQYGTLALFLKDDWDAVSPDRPPGRNDVVTYQGRRYALNDSTTLQPAGVTFLYKCGVKG